MTSVDDDVKVWVAARQLSQQGTDFSKDDLLATLQTLFKAEPKKMERFVADHCVANTEGAGGKHYNYLFRVSSSRFRMWRQGDPIEYSHATAPTLPEVSRVPAEYKFLYATTSRFPAELRPAGLPPKPAETKPATAKTAPKKGAPAEIPTRGLLMDLSGMDQNSPANVARRTIFDMLFLEMGKIGSRLESQKSETFVINVDPHSGSVSTHKNLTVKMPAGIALSHMAEVIVDLDSPSRTLYIDIVESTAPIDELKSNAFDALHLRQDAKARYGILVFVRGPHGVLQEQAESIAYPYDYFFGVDGTHAKDPNKFYALKAQILQWMAGKVKPERAATA